MALAFDSMQAEDRQEVRPAQIAQLPHMHICTYAHMHICTYAHSHLLLAWVILSCTIKTTKVFFVYAHHIDFRSHTPFRALLSLLSVLFFFTSFCYCCAAFQVCRHVSLKSARFRFSKPLRVTLWRHCSSRGARCMFRARACLGTCTLVCYGITNHHLKETQKGYRCFIPNGKRT